MPRGPDRPGAQVAQVRRPQDLHAVDVEDALLGGDELEVDQVRERPQRVVGGEHRQQLCLDGRDDEIGPPFEEVDEGEEDAGEGRGPKELVEGGLGDDGLGGGRVLGEAVGVERGVPEVACGFFFFFAEGVEREIFRDFIVSDDELFESERERERER